MRPPRKEIPCHFLFPKSNFLGLSDGCARLSSRGWNPWGVVHSDDLTNLLILGVFSFPELSPLSLWFG
jgi:hypothetical protein